MKTNQLELDHCHFDFSHSEALTQEQIFSIERSFNRRIRDNYSVVSFGTINGTQVLRMGNHLLEVRASTKIKKTGDLGYFKIITEREVGNAIRRIEGVIGEAAIALELKNESLLMQLQGQLKAPRATLVNTVEQNIAKLNKNKDSIGELEMA